MDTALAEILARLVAMAEERDGGLDIAEVRSAIPVGDDRKECEEAILRALADADITVIDSEGEEELEAEAGRFDAMAFRASVAPSDPAAADSVEHMLRLAAAYPPFTREESIRLARIVQAGSVADPPRDDAERRKLECLVAQGLIKPPPAIPEEERILLAPFPDDEGGGAAAATAQGGPRKPTRFLRTAEAVRARELLARHNIRYVILKARKTLAVIAGPKLDLADAIQEGWQGLLRGIDKFEPDRGYALLTYASHWIEQHIRRANDDAGFIRVPIHVHEKIRKSYKRMYQAGVGVDRAFAEVILEQREKAAASGTGSAELRPEVLARLVERLRETASLIKGAASLDAPLGEDNDVTVGDLTSDRDSSIAVSDEREGAKKELGLRAALILSLVPREREMLLHRADGKTLEQTGALYGVTRERARQIEKKVLERLETDRDRLGRDTPRGRRLRSVLGPVPFLTAEEFQWVFLPERPGEPAARTALRERLQVLGRRWREIATPGTELWREACIDADEGRPPARPKRRVPPPETPRKPASPPPRPAPPLARTPRDRVVKRILTDWEIGNILFLKTRTPLVYEALVEEMGETEAERALAVLVEEGAVVWTDVPGRWERRPEGSRVPASASRAELAAMLEAIRVRCNTAARALKALEARDADAVPRIRRDLEWLERRVQTIRARFLELAERGTLPDEVVQELLRWRIESA